MADIKLRRGDRTVTFKKQPEHFAVRLRSGRITSERTLEAICGRSGTAARHIDDVPTESMSVFALDDPGGLDGTMKQLRAAPASAVVTHMYSMGDSPGTAVIPTGSMTVQFKADLEQKEQEAILAEHGLEVLEDLDFLPRGHIVQLTQASIENPLKIAAKLQRRTEIAIAEPDLGFQVSYLHTPTDTHFRDQWYLENRGDRLGLTAGADVSAKAAWDITRGTRDVVICVMDDGFDLEHPDFAGPGKIVAPRDFGQSDFDPSPAAEDDNHGTACAGVALADENGIGVVGLAPQCALMPIRTSAWLSNAAIMNLFQYAIDNHADVISCSWSASGPYFPLSDTMSGIIHKAATEGRGNGKGCVILFAAGNEDSPLDGVKDGVTYHQGFALHRDVIAVGASNSRDERSDYSNYGSMLTLCAPSSGSPGRRITTTDRRGAKGYSSGDYTVSFGGTSSSTPLAAGLAGLILSVNADLTSPEVKGIMMDTADKIDQEGGHYVDGHSPSYGHGRINAKNAVLRARGNVPAGLPEVLLVEHRINRPIPDQGMMADTITFPIAAAIAAIDVSVEIRHTWSGDLRLVLKSPQGAEIVLQDRVGSSTDDIVKSFRSSAEPQMFEPVFGTPASGEWKLEVQDMYQQDVGVLVKWGVAITY
jgi:subtilisin family serine protease